MPEKPDNLDELERNVEREYQSLLIYERLLAIRAEQLDKKWGLDEIIVPEGMSVEEMLEKYLDPVNGEFGKRELKYLEDPTYKKMDDEIKNLRELIRYGGETLLYWSTHTDWVNPTIDRERFLNAA